MVEHRAPLMAAYALLSIAVGGALHLSGSSDAGDLVWRVAVALLAAELAVEVGRTVLRDHSMGVDTIALIAMIGSLALGQEPRRRRGRAHVLRRRRTGGPCLHTRAVSSRR